MENDEILKANKVFNSAQQQFMSSKKAKNDKIEQVKRERDNIILYRKTLSTIISAVMETYAEVYPRAEGFIEGRIKSLNSLEIKTRNEFSEILAQIEENPKINQREILKKISEINFKDIFAFSVVTTNPPERFQTGNDKNNKEFSELGSIISTSRKEIKEQEEAIKDLNEIVIELTNIIAELREKEKEKDTNDEKERKIEEIKTQILSNEEGKTKETLKILLDRLTELSKEQTKEDIQKELSEKLEKLDDKKHSIRSIQRELERTEEKLKSKLRDLQYKMSEYYVENLSKFSSFKFWGTTPIRTPKRMVKPGFRAVNTGYSVQFTTSDGEEKTIKFEAQGKGGIDYEDAEFSVVGAEYHEDQKTKDGIISKNIIMPDFTIIGNDLTRKIEEEVLSRYNDISTIDGLEEYGFYSEVEELKKYKEKITNEIQKENGNNSLTKQEIKKKMSEAIIAAKESIIQTEIQKKIDYFENEMADSAKFNDNYLNNNKENMEIYEEERKKIVEKYTYKGEKNYTNEQIDHMARLRLLYRIKENEIRDYAVESIPMFFRANISSNDDNKGFIYWFSTGESLYRFFYNRLNGLKDEKGEYKYKPSLQQKNALLRLSGLFDEDLDNFYLYDGKNEFYDSLDNRDENDER